MYNGMYNYPYLSYHNVIDCVTTGYAHTIISVCQYMYIYVYTNTQYFSETSWKAIPLSQCSNSFSHCLF